MNLAKTAETIDAYLEQNPVRVGLVTGLLAEIGLFLIQQPAISAALVRHDFMAAACLAGLSRLSLHPSANFNRMAKGICVGAAISFAATAGLEGACAFSQHKQKLSTNSGITEPEQPKHNVCDVSSAITPAG